MKRRSHKLLLVLTMFVTILVTTAFVSAEGEFAGGDGSVANPYQITTKEHLDNIRNYPDANFKLMNDIIFEDADFEPGGAFHNESAQAVLHRGMRFEEQGWTPIPLFSGSFDGNNYAIVNLYQCSTDYLVQRNGLFTAIEESGSLKNLYLKNCKIIALCYANSSDIACLVNYNKGMIENCTTSGSITVYDTDQDLPVCGGISAVNDGTIKNCANFTQFISHESTVSFGGIVDLNRGIISNCVNGGSITSKAVSTKTPEISYRTSSLAGICNKSSGTVESSLNMSDTISTIEENSGTIKNVVSCFVKTASSDKMGIEYMPREQINASVYTKNDVALKYLSQIDINQAVKNLKSEGYTYKSIKLS